MHFQVHALAPQKFASWVAATGSTGPVLDGGTYAGLAKQSINDRPITFSKAEPGLFQKIVAQAIPPAAGPHAGRPDPGTSSRTE